MTAEQEEASALLDDVAGAESRVRQFLIYAHISDFFFLWGAIFAGGFTATYFLRSESTYMWWGLEAFGLVATIAIAVRRHYRSERRVNRAAFARAGLAMIAVITFGSIWIHLADFGWREEVTFWPSLIAFQLFLVGLWLGRTVVFAALTLFAVTLAGYFFAGDYLHLWMAAAAGGSLLLGGMWLRR